MIEFKTEIKDEVKEEHSPLASTKVTLLYEAASDNEIKIENETFINDYKDDDPSGDPSVLLLKNRIDGNLLNAVSVHDGANNHDDTLNKDVHRCNICNADVVTMVAFLKHQRKFHGRYLCDECDEEFKNRDRLCYHKNRRHKPSDPTKKFECKVENCNFKHKTSNGLRYHILVCHSGGKQHICNICQKSFYQTTDLKKHLWTHTGERPFTCDMCPKGYTTTTKLRHHKLRHIGVKLFVCKFCPKSFSYRETKTIHERSHTGERPYICMQCNKTFKTGSALKCHTYSHNGERRYVCKVCHKSFIQIHHLRQHETIHTGEKPYVCDVCDYRFALVGHLITHRKIHIRGKPFSCTTCQSTFSYKSQLTSHEKIHTTNAPVFICAHCDKTYLEKRSLRKHLSTCYVEHPLNDHIYTSSIPDVQQGSIILRISRLPQERSTIIETMK